MSDSNKNSQQEQTPPEAQAAGYISAERLYISMSHLHSAGYFTRQSAEIERGRLSPYPRDVTREHESYVIGAIFSAVAYLEARINERFADAAEGFGAKELPDEVSHKMAAFWEIENFNKAKLLEKYATALKLAGKEPIDKGSPPYQNVKLLIELRNALMHYRPETVITRALPGATPPEQDLERKLRNKFTLNPFRADKGNVFLDGKPWNPGKKPFFPEMCLSADCARWAVKSVWAFDKLFTNRLGLTWTLGQFWYLFGTGEKWEGANMGRYRVAFKVEIDVEIDHPSQGRDTPETAHRMAMDYLLEGTRAVSDGRKRFLGIKGLSATAPTMASGQSKIKGDAGKVLIVNPNQPWPLTSDPTYRSPFILTRKDDTFSMDDYSE